jgi:hypothetical protein
VWACRIPIKYREQTSHGVRTQDISNSLCGIEVKAGAAKSMLIVFIPRALWRLHWIIQMKTPASVCYVQRSANICYIQLLCSNTTRLTTQPLWIQDISQCRSLRVAQNISFKIPGRFTLGLHVRTAYISTLSTEVETFLSWRPVVSSVNVTRWIPKRTDKAYYHEILKQTKQNKLHGLSPRTNYTDRATAACLRSDCLLLRIEGATWSAWWIPPAVFSVF